jgi:hypothetical protein
LRQFQEVYKAFRVNKQGKLNVSEKDGDSGNDFSQGHTTRTSRWLDEGNLHFEEGLFGEVKRISIPEKENH